MNIMQTEEIILSTGLIFFIWAFIAIVDIIHFKIAKVYYKDYDFDQHIIPRNGIQYVDVGSISFMKARILLQYIKENKL